MIYAGVDEVGRGAIFGPVVACAVIMPADAEWTLRAWGVTDSKQLSPAKRANLAEKITSLAIAWQIGSASPAEIDRFNILQATLLAMERAIMALAPRPDHVWVDGNQPIQFRHIPPIPQTTLIKGDQLNLVIASASIVAKVWRDQWMQSLDRHYPHYDLAKNKGYGTTKHWQAIASHGYTDQHRRSFLRRHGYT